jgi:hypothetical protein
MDEQVLNSPQMTARLIGNRPNTYTFTKVTCILYVDMCKTATITFSKV